MLIVMELGAYLQLASHVGQLALQGLHPMRMAQHVRGKILPSNNVSTSLGIVPSTLRQDPNIMASRNLETTLLAAGQDPYILVCSSLGTAPLSAGQKPHIVASGSCGTAVDTADKSTSITRSCIINSRNCYR
jgi:hypothetical protein